MFPEGAESVLRAGEEGWERENAVEKATKLFLRRGWGEIIKALL